MAKGLGLEIYSFEEISSTQLWLCEQIRTQNLFPPLAVVAKRQKEGIGSRGNQWEETKEALTFSFALPITSLPKDLPLVSSSLFFGYLFKKVLAQRGSKVWLKWPNDLYLGEQKMGGVITSKVGEVVVGGIGLNLDSSNDSYAFLEPEVPKDGLLEEYLGELSKEWRWKQIFSNYEIEFKLNSDFIFHHEGERVSALEATLCEDGALLFRGKKVYSAR